MADVRNLSTDELSQRLAAGNSPQLWNVLTSQSFTGELIPGSRRMPLDTIGREDQMGRRTPRSSRTAVDCAARRVLKPPNA